MQEQEKVDKNQKSKRPIDLHNMSNEDKEVVGGAIAELNFRDDESAQDYHDRLLGLYEEKKQQAYVETLFIFSELIDLIESSDVGASASSFIDEVHATISQLNLTQYYFKDLVTETINAEIEQITKTLFGKLLLRLSGAMVGKDEALNEFSKKYRNGRESTHVEILRKYTELIEKIKILLTAQEQEIDIDLMKKQYEQLSAGLIFFSILPTIGDQIRIATSLGDKSTDAK